MKAIKTLLAALFTTTATLASAADLALLFAGDIMLDDGPGRALAAGRDPLAAFAPILDRADYRIGNLEIGRAHV